jgi:hypothetical protein
VVGQPSPGAISAQEHHARPDGALIMPTLTVVVASQIAGVRSQLATLVAVVPSYLVGRVGVEAFR